MKQKIRVAAIIKNESGVMILKRNRGRTDTAVFWELPTGKIKYGEQPEESIVRALTDYVGLTAKSVKIKDVITFMALEGSNRLSNLYIIYDVTVSGRPDPKERYTAYKFVKDFASSGVHMSEASSAVLEIIEGKAPLGRSASRGTANAATVHVDGASRGNPGPSGIGYCIYDENGKLIERKGEFIGFATSRVAEYYAMKQGITRAIALGLKSVRFVSDSLMVVNQLNGIFSVKNSDIAPIYRDIQQLLKHLDTVSFTHVPRSENSIADSEANAAIDQLLQK